MSEVIVTEESVRFIDDFSNNLQVTYTLFESNDKYKVEVMKDEVKQGIKIKEVAQTNKVLSYNEAMKLIKILIKNKVTPVSINDILEDFNCC